MIMQTSEPFSYEQAEYEIVPCNLCGRLDFEVLDTRDQSGLPVRTVICRWCGLIWINPRMTKEWYGRYYDEEYREQRSQKRGGGEYYSNAAALEKHFGGEQKFGFATAELIKPYVKSGFTIEVGSSVGGVLSGFKKSIPALVPQGIEPSSVEAAFAITKGIPTITSLFENLATPLPPAANVLITRSLNHLLDPKKFLVWSYHQLQPDGRLIIAVQNFRHAAKKRGGLRRAIQIDHTFMFTPETLESFVRAAGFEVLFTHYAEGKPFSELVRIRNRGLTRSHIRLVARKSSQPPFALENSIPLRYPAIRASLRAPKLLSYYVSYWLFRKFVTKI